MVLQTTLKEEPFDRSIRRFQMTREARLSFEQASIQSIPFQLLPHVAYTAQEQEKALRWQSQFAASLPNTPRFSIVVFAPTLSKQSLVSLFESLAVQSYQYFELVVWGIQNEGQFDELTQLFETFGIEGAILRGSETASDLLVQDILDVVQGEFVSFHNPNGLLHPQALFITAKAVIQARPDVVYSNEFIVDASFREAKGYYRKAPPEKYSLLSYNTLGLACFFSTATLRRLVQDAREISAQSLALPWYLSALCVGNGARVEFVPLALFMRADDGGAQQGTLATVTSVENLIVDYAQALGVPLAAVSEVVFATAGKAMQCRPMLIDAVGQVQVVIPFRDQAAVTISCLRSLVAQDVHAELEVWLVNNNSSIEQLEQIEECIAQCPFPCHIVTDTEYFNFARLNNFASEHSDSAYILFLNNDVELSTAGTIRELRNWCSLDDVGAVGGLLCYDDGAVQHAGINFSGVRPRNVTQPAEFIDVVRETNGVTFAMAMVKRKAFQSVGGLDELICPNGFGDAVFCNELRKVGYRTICTPFAQAIHHESKSRGRMPEDLELLEMVRSGLIISDLYETFQAEHQAARISLQPGGAGSPLVALGKRLMQYPWLMRILNTFASALLRTLRLFGKQ